MDRAQAELDALKRTEEDLKKGHQKLEDMVSRLDQEVVRYSFFFFFFFSALNIFSHPLLFFCLLQSYFLHVNKTFMALSL